MRKSTEKKLKLYRETLQSLDAEDLRGIAAGVPTMQSALFQCISDCRGCTSDRTYYFM